MSNFYIIPQQTIPVPRARGRRGGKKHGTGTGKLKPSPSLRPHQASWIEAFDFLKYALDE